MKKIQRFHHQSVKGNTLTEYGFIAAVVCVGSLAVLYAVGGSLNTQLGGVKSEMQSKSAKASTAKATQLAAMRTMEQTLTGGNSTRLASDASESASNRQVQTNGGMGTDYGLKASANGGIGQGLENLSEEQQDAVKDVANTAHEIAEKQAFLDSISTFSHGNGGKFSNIKVVVDGKMETAGSLATQLGQGGLESELEKNTGRVLKSGVGITVKQTVGTLAHIVKNDAKVTKDFTVKAIQKKVDSREVARRTDANNTDRNGVRICGANGGKDSGKRCSGRG